MATQGDSTKESQARAKLLAILELDDEEPVNETPEIPPPKPKKAKRHKDKAVASNETAAPVPEPNANANGDAQGSRETTPVEPRLAAEPLVEKSKKSKRHKDKEGASAAQEVPEPTLKTNQSAPAAEPPTEKPKKNKRSEVIKVSEAETPKEAKMEPAPKKVFVTLPTTPQVFRNGMTFDATQVSDIIARPRVGERQVKGFSFSMMSYNVLCDLYIASHTKSCEPEYLSWNYRLQLLQKEFEHYSPDIIALQEVEPIAFSRDFLPFLRERGYDGVYERKCDASQIIDGCATFFKTNKFEQVKSAGIRIREVAARFSKQASSERLRGFWQGVEQHPHIALCTFLRPKHDCEQPAVPFEQQSPEEQKKTRKRLRHLQRRRAEQGEDIICVVNLHLFWSPSANEIKVTQMFIIAQEAARLAKSLFEPQPAKKRKFSLTESAAGKEAAAANPPAKFIISHLFAGDFNSLPKRNFNDINGNIVASKHKSGVYQLLTDGQLPMDHPDHPVLSGLLPLSKITAAEATAEGLPDFQLGVAPVKSSYHALLGEEPKFTNNTVRFTGCLDYIWFSPASLTVVGVVDFPGMRKLPNKNSPSDHIFLLAHFVLP